MSHEHDHALDYVDPYLHEALEPADALQSWSVTAGVL